MSRLLKRLKGYQKEMPSIQIPYEQEQYPEYPQEEYPEYPVQEQYPEEHQQPIPENQESALVQEYERLQKKATEYDREMAVIEAENPHSLYKEVINKTSDKGAYQMRVFGRPVDLASLENYLIYKISPKTVTTLMRYNDARSIEEIKGYSKRPTFKIKSGIIWIVLGAAALLIIGIVVMTQGGSMSEMMKGMFGGL